MNLGVRWGGVGWGGRCRDDTRIPCLSPSMGLGTAKMGTQPISLAVVRLEILSEHTIDVWY